MIEFFTLIGDTMSYLFNFATLPVKLGTNLASLVTFFVGMSSHFGPDMSSFVILYCAVMTTFGLLLPVIRDIF